MIKQFAALSSAAFFGLWLGVTWTGNLAYQPVGIGTAPAWAAPAREMQALAIVGLMACVGGWILLDWRGQNTE